MEKTQEFSLADFKKNLKPGTALIGIGCGMPKKNKLKSTVDWGTASSANGLQDIEDAVVAAFLLQSVLDQLEK